VLIQSSVFYDGNLPLSLSTHHFIDNLILNRFIVMFLNLYKQLIFAGEKRQTRVIPPNLTSSVNFERLQLW
jgi:hypothetical protein